jgi:hypothetical protein
LWVDGQDRGGESWEFVVAGGTGCGPLCLEFYRFFMFV